MFIIPCKYIPSSPIQECIESIQRYHPEDKIVIVDSCSEDKSYLNQFVNIKNISILDVCNNNYVIGALWHTYKHFSSEPFYILLHDSIILKKTIPQKYLLDSNFYTFMYFNETIPGISSQEYLYYLKFFNTTKYKIPEPNSIINGCFGTLGIFKQNIINKFIENGVHHVFPQSKFECNMFERLLGICATQEQFNPSEFNLEGNYLEKCNNLTEDKLQYFKKLFFFNKR
jgi:hypothetical protein